MSSAATSSGRLPARVRLHDVIVRRPRVATVTGLLLALVFAAVVTPIVLVEAWAVDARVGVGQRAAVTVRLGADDAARVGGDRSNGGVIIARGEIATPAQAEAVAIAVAGTPRGASGWGAYALVLFALAAGFTHHLKRSNRGRLLRVQLVLLGTIALGALVTKTLLLILPLSVLAVPVALGAIVPTMVFDRTVGLAGGVLAAVTMSLLVPFDVGVLIVLVVQAVSAAIVIPERPRARWALALTAGAVALAGAALAYLAFASLSGRAMPFDELATPAASSFLAALVGGAMSGVLAMPVLPLFERACGEITHGKLVALEDLSLPLLRQIAEKSPGTWQHSLAMANLAEVAANAIGASGRLVRVGAYYHDLGKSLQATYFIENLAVGEPSPHDQLAPEVSCDAIFAHVTEGILLARRHKLPERIVDFMHMHHGDGVLEYFWAKCQELGNPRGLTVDDFRYPGVPPQSRETAILAICDAVEAASRTLKRPDARSVETLVQRIVYGKLHLGQLDESGLSMADLRRMSDSLRETIRHAHHGRIEYPWQREAATAEAAAAATSPTAAGSARPVRSEDRSLANQRLMSEPRLDSLDVPRPIQWDDRGREAGLDAVITPPPTTATPAARRPSEPSGFGDTVELAMATTAGLGLVAPAAASEPIAGTSVGPTADALADAVVNASAPGDHPGRPRTSPPTATLRGPAPTLARLARSLDQALAVEGERPVSERTTQPIDVPTVEARITRAQPAEPTPTASAPIPAFHPVPSAQFDVPALAARTPGESSPAALIIVDDEPEIEIAIAIETAPPATDGGAWLGRLSARFDAMLDADDQLDSSLAATIDLDRPEAPDSFAGDTARRVPPAPPPGRSRPIPRITQPVAVEDVEATLELSPTVRDASGGFVGPPPATRAGRTAQVPRIAAPPPPAAEAPDPAADDGDDDRPTVVGPRPDGSMLPPRPRRGPDPT